MVKMISAAEKQFMTNYINRFVQENRREVQASPEHLLRFWSINKRSLFHMFGDQLILSQNVSVDVPEEVLDANIDELQRAGKPGFTFTNAFKKWTREQPFCLNAEGDDYNEAYWQLRSLMWSSTLKNNKYSEGTIKMPLPNGKTLKIQDGDKAVKVLGKIAKAYDLPGFEEFRIAHSMCFNDKQLKGELCLSIHPLDYMTMSDNECGWKSCMNWRHVGEYRQGTVEMMNSPYVVVAYLKSDKDMTFDFGSWNNKRWRSLFIVHPQAIISVRQYPYYSEDLDKICLQWLRDLASPIEGYGPYASNWQELRNETDIEHCETGEQIDVDIATNFMYNDIQYYHKSYLAHGINCLYFNYSGEAECMICGDEIEYNDDDFDDCCRPSALCCVECMEYTECAHCGRRVYGSSDLYEVEGAFVCYHCREDETRYCVWNEQYYWEENIIDLYVKAEGRYVQNVRMPIFKGHALNTPDEFIAKFGCVYYDDEAKRYYVNAEAFGECWNSYFGIWSRSQNYEVIERARGSEPKSEEFWDDLPFQSKPEDSLTWVLNEYYGIVQDLCSEYFNQESS